MSEQTETTAQTPIPAASKADLKKSLAREFAWALLYAAFGLLVVLLGSSGPQFIYAGF